MRHEIEGKKQKRLPLSLIFSFSLVSCLLSRVPSLYACPMCSNLLERSKEAVKFLRFSTGVSWSILLMLSVPYLIIGSAVFLIWRATKKKQHESLPRP